MRGLAVELKPAPSQPKHAQGMRSMVGHLCVGTSAWARGIARGRQNTSDATHTQEAHTHGTARVPVACVPHVDDDSIWRGLLVGWPTHRALNAVAAHRYLKANHEHIPFRC